MTKHRIDRTGRIVPIVECRNPNRQRSTRQWTRLSRQQRARVPYCQVCGATSNLEADHITPLSMGGALTGPLRTLCHKCNT